MICAGDCAGKDAEYGIGIAINDKKRRSQDRSHSCVLHSDLDGESLFLRQRKFEKSSDIVAEQIADAIVQKYHRQNQKEQRDAIADQLWLHLTHHAANNQRQTNDAASRHHRLQRLEILRLARKIIEQTAQ